ncbi:MAG TPA: hypothetical protein VFP44_05185 [Usitatibacter sp.]|nr:hypothetical protein [Usitatibacter sp.]
MLAVSIIPLVLTGCASWSTSSAEGFKDAVARPAKSANEIVLTEGDITNRAYTVIGDISVTVNKTTIFNADPTREMVNQELRKEAAAKGADAVVLVRYGTVGVGLMSWGSLEGKGRAVVFK